MHCPGTGKAQRPPINRAGAMLLEQIEYLVYAHLCAVCAAHPPFLMKGDGLVRMVLGPWNGWS